MALLSNATKTIFVFIALFIALTAAVPAPVTDTTVEKAPAVEASAPETPAPDSHAVNTTSDASSGPDSLNYWLYCISETDKYNCVNFQSTWCGQNGVLHSNSRLCLTICNCEQSCNLRAC